MVITLKDGELHPLVGPFVSDLVVLWEIDKLNGEV